MVDLVKLEELAKAATQGTWEGGTTDGWNLPWCVRSDAKERGYVAECDTTETAAFIAAANPATILDLLAEIERLRGRNGKLRILASYIAGTNDDEIRVALAGNPTACDSLISLAAAIIREQEE